MSICRHFKWKDVDEYHKECEKCGVWKGTRSDAHHYTKEYFYDTPGFPYFLNGIPQRSTVFAKFAYHAKQLGLDLDREVHKDYGYRALEVASGVGFIAYTLSKLGWNVDVIEQSDWACTFMLEAFGESLDFHIFRGNYENMDVSRLDNYHLIYNNHVLEHLDRPDKCVMEWCQHLRDEGTLLITIPDKEQEKHFHHSHNWAFDVDVLTNWFDSCGLRNIRHTILELPDNVHGCHIMMAGDK